MTSGEFKLAADKLESLVYWNEDHVRDTLLEGVRALRVACDMAWDNERGTGLTNIEREYRLIREVMEETETDTVTYDMVRAILHNEYDCVTSMSYSRLREAVEDAVVVTSMNPGRAYRLLEAGGK